MHKIEGGLRSRGLSKPYSKDSVLVTVITVVFNGEAYLEDTIRSVLGQSYKNIEYIIVDGGSDDSTVDIIRRFDEKLDYWLSEPDGGIYDAMNKGVELAKGQLIGILNADDWYEQTAIEKVVQSSEKASGAILHGGMICLSSDGHSHTLRSKETAKENLVRMTENHPAMFVPASVYKRVGKYDLTYKSIADWDFVIRCHRSGVRFVWLDEILTNFRLGGNSSNLSLERVIEKWRLRTAYGHRWTSLVFVRELFKLFVARAIARCGLRSHYHKLRRTRS